MPTIRKTADTAVKAANTAIRAKKSVDRVKAEARSRWDKLTDEDFDSIKTNVV